MRANLVGDPSIVFHPYHEVGLTCLWFAEHDVAGKLCHSVRGVDANALYIYCIMQNMLMGEPVKTQWIKEG